jgi:ABC-type transport system substrate-binding protein/sugar lactone lactonase YvrE
LNLAARLCSIARPGEILASPELAHLARQLDGMSYVAAAPIRLKGLPEPVRPRRVLPDGEDPVAQLVALKALPPPPAPSGPGWLPTWLRGRRALAAVVVVLALVAAAVLVSVRSSGSSLKALDENVVGVIDADSAHLVAQTPVGGSPAALAVDTDAVWVADIDSGTVSRVNRDTNTVTQRTRVGQSPAGVLVAAGSVWVANSGDGSVSRLDMHGQILDTIKVGSGPSALAYDNGTVWVADTSANAVFAIDPKSGAPRRLAVVDGAPTGIAAANGRLWVTSPVTGTVVAIDERSGAVQQRVQLGNDPRGVAVSGGAVWVANNLNGTVTRIDASTGLTGASLPVGDSPVAVVATRNTVWVASSVSRQVTEIDPRKNRVVATTSTGSAPTALALSAGHVYVAAGSNPVLHRGGTMTVALAERVALDPTRGYDVVSEPVNAMLYDGLLGFRREPGAAGAVVVPDLAQALPTVSADGLTYTFRLRTDVAWSNGATVTGADVRHGIERAVVADQAPTLYERIVGVTGCKPTHCDLSDGVAVDDNAHTVEIHLSAPDPELLDKLAVPIAPAAPVTAPLDKLGGYKLPSTGPYAIAATTRDGGLVLTRNPKFREWSAAAQPAGYPDRIEFTFADPTAEPRATVDWSAEIQPGDIGALKGKYGDRLRTNPGLSANYVFLNTTVPPFNNVLARRAAAYAIDRMAVADGWFEPGNVACTMLPPSVPGAQPYCPYTLHAGADGTWHAPDVSKALDLVRRSGTGGTSVSVYAGVAFPGMQAVVQALNSIGYRAKLVAIGLPFFDKLTKVHAPQAGLAGWTADYPAASNFLESQFECHGPSNLAMYCDRRVSAQMKAALRLQVEAPAEAAARWAAIDHELVDAAPMVPLVNPIDIDLVSERLRHAERNPAIGPLFDKAWVH